jgi:hypothetical protein
MFPVNETAKGFIADHFRKRRVALTEDSILEVIRAPRSKYDVYWGVLALRDIGTTRSIPVLKNLLHYPMQDVRDCSLLTIAHIAGAAETDFFVEALADKRTRKTYPMWAIEVAADGRALPAVVEFVNTALKKATRRNPADPGDAYLSGVRYLARIGMDQPECRSSLELLRQAWPNLPEGHRSALRAVLPSQAIPQDVKAG